MVEVGELTVVGSFDGSQIDSGFDRLNNNLNETENQANQTNASLGKTDLTLTSLTKAAIGFGLAGVAAVTAIATKSPVLAGSMAKIEVETLKLSNVLGGQLKPIFDEIGQDLIPAIASAFVNANGEMTTLTNKTVNLIAALSDLITLDFSGLLTNLDKLFAPKNLSEIPEGQTESTISQTDPFRETKQSIANIFTRPEGNALSGQYQLERWTTAAKLPFNIIIDFFQWISNNLDSKEATFANATGVPR